MDVINLISKDPRFPDAEPALGPDAPYHPGSKYYVNGPHLHDYLREINREVLSKYNTITVGEMPGISDINEIIKTVGSKSGELRMIFIFDLVDIDNVPGKERFSLQEWDLKEVKRIVNKWQRAMIDHDGWNSVFIENHDNPRSVSRYVDDSDKYREKGAKLLALMQTTLSGTLYVYQGEEIGMRNVPPSWDPSEYKDIEAINFWKKTLALYPHDKEGQAYGRKILQAKARDHSRTPVQWDATANAGFCKEGVEPWMRVNDDYKSCNAEAQMNFQADDEMSVWQYWQRALSSRKEHKDVFVYGDFQILDEGNQKVFAYKRVGEIGGTWLVVLNWSGEATEWDVPGEVSVQAWVAGTYGKGKPGKEVKGKITLEPWEGILGKCE